MNKKFISYPNLPFILESVSHCPNIPIPFSLKTLEDPSKDYDLKLLIKLMIRDFSVMRTIQFLNCSFNLNCMTVA